MAESLPRAEINRDINAQETGARRLDAALTSTLVPAKTFVLNAALSHQTNHPVGGGACIQKGLF